MARWRNGRGDAFGPQLRRSVWYPMRHALPLGNCNTMLVFLRGGGGGRGRYYHHTRICVPCPRVLFRNFLYFLTEDDVPVFFCGGKYRRAPEDLLERTGASEKNDAAPPAWHASSPVLVFQGPPRYQFYHSISTSFSAVFWIDLRTDLYQKKSNYRYDGVRSSGTRDPSRLHGGTVPGHSNPPHT